MTNSKQNFNTLHFFSRLVSRHQVISCRRTCTSSRTDHPGVRPPVAGRSRRRTTPAYRRRSGLAVVASAAWNPRSVVASTVAVKFPVLARLLRRTGGVCSAPRTCAVRSDTGAGIPPPIIPPRYRVSSDFKSNERVRFDRRRLLLGGN